MNAFDVGRCPMLVYYALSELFIIFRLFMGDALRWYITLFQSLFLREVDTQAQGVDEDRQADNAGHP